MILRGRTSSLGRSSKATGRCDGCRFTARLLLAEDGDRLAIAARESWDVYREL
jgi:hypothetical protein